MPATSKAQRRLMAIGDWLAQEQAQWQREADAEAARIAEHHPSEVYAKNRGVLKMTHSQLHDFADTKERKLPHYKAQRHPHRNLGSRKHGNYDWSY